MQTDLLLTFFLNDPVVGDNPKPTTRCTFVLLEYSSLVHVDQGAALLNYMWERRRWLHVTLNSPWNRISNWYCLAAERERQRGNEDASKHPAPSLHPSQPSLLLLTRLNLNPPSPPSFALNIVSLYSLQQLARPQLESSQLKPLEILGNFLLHNNFWGYHIGL